MRTPAAPTIAVALLFLGAAAGLIAYLVTTRESAGPESGTTLTDVIDDPSRFEGERVSVSGEWAENRYFGPDQAEELIALGDDAENSLLVVPQLGVDVPEMDEDTVVSVEGVVRIPERAGAGALAPDALMAREGGGVAPLLAADSVELVPAGEEPLAVEAEQATVPQLLRDPRAWDERPLNLTGTLARVTQRGFALAQNGATIFVSAPASELGALEAGDRVQVRAELSRLSAYGSDALEQALQGDSPADQPQSAFDLEELPIDRGEPYLLMRALDTP
jgi:hypothetical protein